MRGDRGMRAPRQPRKRFDPRIPIIVIVLLVPFIIFMPGLSENGIGKKPAFSSPNVLVDKGPGWVDGMPPGGPSIAVGAGNELHTVWDDNRTGTEWGIYYAHSPDGGKTWEREKRIDGALGTMNLAPAIAIDMTGGPNHGNIYVTWQIGEDTQADVYFVKSTDGGNTWVDRRRVDTAPTSMGSMYPQVAVDVDGSVCIAFQDRRRGNDDIYFTRSDDGGVSWIPNIPVSPGEGTNFIRYPSIATAGKQVHIVWQERDALASTLWLATSTDKGSSWQRKMIANRAGEMLSVFVMADEFGTVHVAWVVRWSVYDNVGLLPYPMVEYSQSNDNGVSWSIPVRVDDAPLNQAHFPNGITILRIADTLYTIWADNRNDDYDVYVSWSEDDGKTWGDGLLNNNDVRVDDTDENVLTTDDATHQTAPAAVAGCFGLYVVWGDTRSISTSHVYSASFELGGMLITEVRDSPDGMEQIEIFNYGTATTDTTGWSLVVDGMSIPLDPLGVIPPMAYRTIGDPASSDLSINIALGDEGGRITILESSGAKQDLMAYGQLGPPPDPLQSESVSRISSSGAYLSLWTRSSTPTFGAQNAGQLHLGSSTLVLNEVLFNAANPNSRFIEIHLKGNSTVDIGGYVLTGDSHLTLPSVSLSETSSYHPIRSWEAPSLFSSMDTSGDNIYLYSPAGALLDMVGWSSPHTQGMSMARVPEGNGTADGYDDTTSVAAGWSFDQEPSLALVHIGPDQTSGGNLGERIFYDLVAINQSPTDEYLNIEVRLGLQGWPVTTLQADGLSPLIDSPGDPDDIPDVGVVPAYNAAALIIAVDIPSVPPSIDEEVGEVKVKFASDTVVSARATLRTQLLPYELPTATVSPSAIYVDTSPVVFQPQETLMRLGVSGRGIALRSPVVQDTVFLIDASGSMEQNDPNDLRLAAARRYADLLTFPDRAAVVSFNVMAMLVNGSHLSSNYTQVKANIDTIEWGGATYIPDAIEIGTNELITYGDPNHKWFEILLTDGIGGPDALILAEAQRAADNNIVIFTVGLGDGVNHVVLREVANLTDGIYLKVQNAEDLDEVFLNISNYTKAIAGYDDNVTDSIPMISVFLPNHINYVHGSANPAPAYMAKLTNGTNLQWNLSELRIGENWTATFRITSSLAGLGLLALSYPESRVTYMRYDDQRVDFSFTETFVDVLSTPPPETHVEANYKPIVALIFSIILAATAAYLAKKRHLPWGKKSWRRFLISWAVFGTPFIVAEVATGVLSLHFEALRIPPLVGWGTGVDVSILVVGMLFLFLRLSRKKIGKVKAQSSKADE